MDRTQVKALVDQQEPVMVSYRNWLHENPEVAFQEYNTSAFIRSKMTQFGYKVLEGYPETAVVCDYETGKEGPSILIRADIDALPLTETMEWEHKSRNDGVMHACGHDMHAACLLSLAQIISEHSGIAAKGKIRFVFQPAEEKPPGGAQSLIEAGVLDGIDMCFALHTGSSESGTIELTRGHASMNTAEFHIEVTGKGGHTGTPYLAKDPIAAMMDIALGIQRITPERLDPTRTNTISVASMHAGTDAAPNIIPNEGNLAGTVRCLYAEDMETSLQAIHTISEHVCAMRGCTCDVRIVRGYPGMVNDDHCVDLMIAAAEAVGVKVIEVSASPAGEDYAYYQMKKPGGYFSLGLSNSSKPEVAMLHHNPRFFIDEEGMRYGLEIMLKLVSDLCE